jgi:hypothetical protein
MFDNIQTKVAIGVAAGIWFVIALFSGSQAVPMVALKTVSIAGTAVTILFLLYDRYIWKWKPVRIFTGKPLVAGTWRGKLRSDYERPGETHPIRPIQVAVRIKQTNSNIAITMFTVESESTSRQGLLFKENDDRWCVSWLYENTPRQSVQHRSPEHDGACRLYLSGKSGERLTGRYFTSRKTTGEVELLDWNTHAYSDARSAFKADDFGPAHPFARNQLS